MRAAFGSDSVGYMQRQLKEWIDLSLNRNLPSSLLLLSRAFIFTRSTAARPAQAQVMDAVKETIGTFDDEVVSDMQVSLDEENKIEAEKKLEYIKQQEELIAEEEVQMAEHEQMYQTQELTKMEEDLALKKTSQLKKVASALAVLASASTVSEERQAFVKVVQKGIRAYQSKLAEKAGAQLLFSGGRLIEHRPAEEPEDPEESVASNLSGKVSKMLKRLDKELDSVEQKVKTTMKVVDKDDDGLVTREEVLGALGFLKEELGQEDLEVSGLLGRTEEWAYPDPSISLSFSLSLSCAWCVQQELIQRLDSAGSSSQSGQIDFGRLLSDLEGKDASPEDNWIPPYMRAKQ